MNERRVVPEPYAVPTENGEGHQDKATPDQLRLARATLCHPDTKFRVDPFQRYKDKVCIVGFTDHRKEAFAPPYDDGTWERWGLNELYRYEDVSVFDRWFEIHGRTYLEQDEDGRKHMKDLGAGKDENHTWDIPIYMQVRHDDIPCSVVFPKDQIIKALASTYWTNCPAWMIGLAIAMGYKEIAVVGIDMAQDTEYAVQRPCCEYWLGFARGRGIEVTVPDTSDLMAHVGLYGYENDGTRLSRKMAERLKWLHETDNTRLAAIRGLDASYQAQNNKLLVELERCNGAIMELEKMRTTPTRKARLEELTTHAADTQQKLESLKQEYTTKREAVVAERNQIMGSIQNTEYFMRAWMVKADGVEPGIPDRTKDPRTGITEPADRESAMPTLEGVT